MNNILLIIFLFLFVYLSYESKTVEEKQKIESITLFETNKYNNIREDSLYGRILNSSSKIHIYDSRPTNAHETTHLANSEYNTINKYAYLIGDRLTYLDKIYFPMNDLANIIPAEFRGSRYNLYLIQQQVYFKNIPMYVFDEWVAYLNGLEVAIKDNINEGKIDRIVPVAEFSVYSIFLGKIIKERYPEYWPEFRKFIYYNLKRSEELFYQGKQISNLNWDTDLDMKINNNSEIVKILKEDYESVWLR